jgi:hypothetical protein
MVTLFPDGASSQAAYLDAWHVQVIRPGEGVIGEDSGGIGPNDSTIGVELSVELNTSCEVLTIRIELSAGGQVWYQASENHEICSGSGNAVQAIEMEWVRPAPTLSASAFTFSVQEGRMESQSLIISYTGSDGMTWTAWVQEGNAPWLIVQPSSGPATSGQPGEITVLVDATALNPGQYTAHIIVAGDGFPQPIGEIPVQLTVTQAPRIEMRPAGPLVFSVPADFGPVSQPLTVTNTGGGVLNWSASVDAGWLALEPSEGALGSGQSQEVAVTVTSQSLQPGNYLAAITVLDPEAENSPQILGVTLDVGLKPMIGLSFTSLSFSAVEGESPAIRILRIENVGADVLNWTATEDGAWLSLFPGSGSLGSGEFENVIVRVTSGTLDPGDYQATITVSDPEAGNSPQLVPVHLTVAPRTPPTLSNLTVDLVTVNDPSCWNDGTRYNVSFDYSDPDGDVAVGDGVLLGNAVRLEWVFVPGGSSGEDFMVIPTNGDRFSGQAYYSTCIIFGVGAGITGRMETYTLRDEWGLWSNSLTVTIPRPGGAYSPAQGSPPGGGTAEPQGLVPEPGVSVGRH